MAIRHQKKPTILESRDNIIFWLSLALFIVGFILLILAISYINKDLPVIMW